MTKVAASKDAPKLVLSGTITKLKTFNNKQFEKYIIILLKKYGFQSINKFDVKDESDKVSDSYLLAQRDGLFYEIRTYATRIKIQDKHITEITNKFRDSPTQIDNRILFINAEINADIRNLIDNMGITFNTIDYNKIKELVAIIEPDGISARNGFKAKIAKGIDALTLSLNSLKIKLIGEPTTVITDKTIEQAINETIIPENTKAQELPVSTEQPDQNSPKDTKDKTDTPKSADNNAVADKDDQRETKKVGQNENEKSAGTEDTTDDSKDNPAADIENSKSTTNNAVEQPTGEATTKAEPTEQDAQETEGQDESSTNTVNQNEDTEKPTDQTGDTHCVAEPDSHENVQSSEAAESDTDMLMPEDDENEEVSEDELTGMQIEAGASEDEFSFDGSIAGTTAGADGIEDVDFSDFQTSSEGTNEDDLLGGSTDTPDDDLLKPASSDEDLLTPGGEQEQQETSKEPESVTVANDNAVEVQTDLSEKQSSNENGDSTEPEQEEIDPNLAEILKAQESSLSIDNCSMFGEDGEVTDTDPDLSTPIDYSAVEVEVMGDHNQLTESDILSMSITDESNDFNFGDEITEIPATMVSIKIEDDHTADFATQSDDDLLSGTGANVNDNEQENNQSEEVSPTPAPPTPKKRSRPRGKNKAKKNEP